MSVAEIDNASTISDSEGVVSYTAYPSHNFDEIYAKPAPVSLFCHRKIPLELYNCKIWDHARERLVAKWRQIFSKNFKERWLWIVVTAQRRLSKADLADSKVPLPIPRRLAVDRQHFPFPLHGQQCQR